MPFLKVGNLTKTYGEGDSATHVLKGISFSIEHGEFVAIMGPSGSGKSTLLHILGLLDDITSGTYRVNDKESSTFTPEELASTRNMTMGFVFQSFNLLGRTSVLENVMLPLLYSRVPQKEWEEKARNAIHSVGLSHRINHHPSQLSGGEKQRVAIARALVNNPQLIFADEPTGNLDSVSGNTVMELLQHLHEVDKHTIILITHETSTAEHAERIIRLRDGVIESDTQIKERRIAKEKFNK